MSSDYSIFNTCAKFYWTNACIVKCEWIMYTVDNWMVDSYYVIFENNNFELKRRIKRNQVKIFVEFMKRNLFMSKILD